MPGAAPGEPASVFPARPAAIYRWRHGPEPDRPGRFPEERDAVLTVGGQSMPPIPVKHFAGRPSAHVPPWVEVSLPCEDERLAAEILAALAALLRAGCTWFKDWYFAEGGREGDTELQGNKPSSAELQAEQVARMRSELEAWLAHRPANADEILRRARQRARAALT